MGGCPLPALTHSAANRIVKLPVQCAHKTVEENPELNYMKMRRIALRKSYKLVMKNASPGPNGPDRPESETAGQPESQTGQTNG